MVFRSGPFGQGYYADDKVDAVPAASAAGASTSGGAAHTPASAAATERELDAAEVFSTLPLSMQVAFEARDIAALDAALAALPPEEAEIHMSRCVASGLWDPGAGGGGNGAAEADQEPSPTGESDAPGSSSSSPQQPGSPEVPNAGEEEAAAQAEARALEERARQAQEAAASTTESTAPTTDLFERGPYRNGGPQTDAAPSTKSTGGAQQAGKRPPIGKGKVPMEAPSQGKGRAGAGAGGSSNVAAMQEQIASLQAQLQNEQRGRMHFEQENGKAQAALDRVRTKLDEAERFKSDEARAMAAATREQKRLRAENEQLRQLLQQHGIEVPASESDDASAKTAEGGAPLSGFDAAVKPSEEISEISFPPASLDPDEVLQSLPQSMQAAFDALDVAALHAALAALPPAEASEYMRRCVASGLWDPNGAAGAVDAS